MNGIHVKMSFPREEIMPSTRMNYTIKHIHLTHKMSYFSRDCLQKALNDVHNLFLVEFTLDYWALVGLGVWLPASISDLPNGQYLAHIKTNALTLEAPEAVNTLVGKAWGKFLAYERTSNSSNIQLIDNSIASKTSN